MMAEDENNCNGECHQVYPTEDGHIKQRVGDERFLGSKAQFCAAFYHVHQWGNRPRYCLDQTNCIIGHRATIENNPSAQAKTVVAVVKFEDANGILYEARYTNCSEEQKHAEDFFKEDIENGELGEKVEANSNGTITLYLTYQPCNKSTGTANANPNQSCCAILLEIYQTILQQHTISLCVKAANTCRLIVDQQDNNDSNVDVDEEIAEGDNNEVKNEKYRKNAVRGIKRLMIIDGVNVSGMIGNDWDYLLAMTNPDVQHNYDERRQHLDNSVQQTFTAIQNQLN
jgi:hypothetical protein